MNSSLIGRTTVIGFYIDWFIEWFAGKGYFTIMTTSASFYGGMCFYISGMVNDFRAQLQGIDKLILEKRNGQLNESEVRKRFRRVIHFHSEIVE